ncbi:transporter substrate-binding domain-containing protein [Rhodospirillaceae bacterium KN72]|uniref:Transporter substrate-binding domain-containing protein n=1 Tax=Pacificispira spongiicola TaxID=2729598 RepID=A0A7Y0DXM2_9PROT|nr:transporter substrate-binding domain-containing protein [Pacificispira spongiicola]NMM43480.1 transporter substrate-binding domain-containing protein [Pacificispira spongiicola]
MFEELERRFLSAMRDAYICVISVKLPQERAHRMLISGEIDGHIARTAEYESRVKDVAVRVPTPFVVGQGKLISSRDDWKDVTTVGVVLGFQWQQDALQKFASRFGEGVTIFTPTKSSSLLRMFVARRVDAIFVTNLEYRDLIAQYPNHQIPISESLSLGGYTYLRRDMEKFIGSIDAAIRQYQRKSNREAKVDGAQN